MCSLQQADLVFTVPVDVLMAAQYCDYNESLGKGFDLEFTSDLNLLDYK